MPVLAALVLVGFAAGCWVQPPEWLQSAALSLPLVGLAFWFGGCRTGLPVCAYALTAIAGFAHLEQVIPTSIEGQGVVLQGRVVSFPAEQGAVFVFEVAAATEGAQVWPHSGTRLRLTSYDPDVRPRAGETWQLLARLKQPHGFVNPGLFDRAVWLLEKKIAAAGYVPPSPLNRRVAGANYASSPLGWRLDLRERLRAVAGESAAFPFIVGLTTGARDLLTAEHWRVLRDTGTSHLMAISGLHIGLVAMFCWLLGSGIARSTTLPVAGLFSFAGAALYALLAGLTVPTQRALVMVVVVLLLRRQRRCFRGVDVLAMAMLVVLFVHPHALLAAGFWLSFLAVLLLVTCAPEATAMTNVVRRAWRTQWLLTLGLALPTVYFFGQVSLLALPANLIAVPVFAFLIVPLILVGAVLVYVHLPAAAVLLHAGAKLLECLLALLERLALLEQAIFILPGAGSAALGFAGLGSLLLALPRPLSAPVAGMVLLAGAVLMPRQDDSLPRMHVLDVGQGLAVLVLTEAGNMLYDTGPAWPGNDAGSAVVVPRLRALGVRHIDTLVVSHSDNDHRGGLESVLKDFTVGRIYRQRTAANDGISSEVCRRGISWQSGAVDFRFLHPRIADGWSDNNASCVLQIQVNQHSIMLPGDIEEVAEQVLLTRPELRAAQIVVAPHHGSATSSSQSFVEQLRPEYVVFAVGYRNRWNFPAMSVQQRWEVAGSCALDMSRTGALEFAYEPASGFRLVDVAATRWLRPGRFVLRKQLNAVAKDPVNGLGGGL